MSSRNLRPNEDRPRPPAIGRSSSTPAGIPSAETVPAVPTPRPRKSAPMPPVSAAPVRRSILPVALGCGLVTAIALAGAGYFALANSRTKDQLAEANRNAAQARDDYEQAAGSRLQREEDEKAQASAVWVRKDKELIARAAAAERERDDAHAQTAGELSRVKSAQVQTEVKLAGAQNQLASANREIVRLRSQALSSTRQIDELLRSSNNDIRNWFAQQFAALPPLNSRQEIRVALRKHEMCRLIDSERKKLDKLVYEAAGTLVLGNSESGLAFRSAILRFSTISSPISTNVADVKLVSRWNVADSATSLDPGDDDITSYTGVTGGSPDGSKDLRFDYRKTDDRFQKLDAMSPIAYKGEKSRMVFCVQFKERGDPTLRWLIFRANAIERGK